jgi:cysteinyl-tRNA synthetase
MLRLRNTLTRQIEEITPLEPGHIGMYSCGPTVYRPVHVGNLRSFLLADFVERTLTYNGLQVRKIMNITDVGHMTDEFTDEGRDRMLLAMEDESLSTAEIAEKYTQAFLADTDAVNIRRASEYPRATAHISQIIELIAKLVERGHAYESGGTVYYDVTTFQGYGALSGQSLDAMRAGYRIENVDTSKRNHQDFTLWVSAGQRRELVFDSPWGKGYPGWHIECSAMSLHCLGERFDLHTGGVDNRFPHHEDEIAQSEGAVGHRVVNMWVHGEHLLMGQLKMAKSAGNVVTIQNLIEAGTDPLAFRYLCFTGRYRRQVHFTQEALDGAATALRRLREQIALLGASGQAAVTDAEMRDGLKDGALTHQDRFVSALNDDLDFPTALTVLHEMVADTSLSVSDRWSLAASWDEVLGLDLIQTGDLPMELGALIRQRDEARAGRDFQRADEIRDRLRAEGVELLDSSEGTRWVRR